MATSKPPVGERTGPQAAGDLLGGAALGGFAAGGAALLAPAGATPG
ncbi:MAG: hypothetical protein JWO31_1078, partial [Phycisphaerales bacterium]|nr:hypothetical protein [Phycisphaerales bacterium]